MAFGLDINAFVHYSQLPIFHQFDGPNDMTAGRAQTPHCRSGNEPERERERVKRVRRFGLDKVVPSQRECCLGEIEETHRITHYYYTVDLVCLHSAHTAHRHIHSIYYTNIYKTSLYICSSGNVIIAYYSYLLRSSFGRSPSVSQQTNCIRWSAAVRLFRLS